MYLCVQQKKIGKRQERNTFIKRNFQKENSVEQQTPEQHLGDQFNIFIY